MSERLRRSRRVLAVQSQLDRLAQWSLIDLQSQAVVLGDQQRGLVRFMSEESLVAGIFSSTMMRRLQTLAEMLATIASEQDVQRKNADVCTAPNGLLRILKARCGARKHCVNSPK